MFSSSNVQSSQRKHPGAVILFTKNQKFKICTYMWFAEHASLEMPHTDKTYGGLKWMGKMPFSVGLCLYKT